MKKTLFLLCAVMLVSSLCAAQEAQAPKAQSAPTAADIKIFTGWVEAVVLADLANKMPARVIATNEKGDRLIFLVYAGTPIIGREGKRIYVSKLKKDDQVVMEYTLTSHKNKIVQSIKVTQ